MTYVRISNRGSAETTLPQAPGREQAEGRSSRARSAAREQQLLGFYVPRCAWLQI